MSYKQPAAFPVTPNEEIRVRRMSESEKPVISEPDGEPVVRQIPFQEALLECYYQQMNMRRPEVQFWRVEVCRFNVCTSIS